MLRQPALKPVLVLLLSACMCDIILFWLLLKPRREGIFSKDKGGGGFSGTWWKEAKRVRGG